MNLKLHSFKYLFAMIFLTAMSLKSFSQAVVNSESFTNATFPPTGWVLKPTMAGGAAGQYWTRNTGAGAIAQPHTAPGDAAFRRAGTGSLIQSLATPNFDLTGRGSNAASVTFWMYRDTNFITSLDSMCVYINNADSVNGSAVKIGTIARNCNINMPNTQPGNGWYQYTFNYPASYTGATNYLIFEGHSDPANTRRMYIDDINWDTWPPACSGTPNAGTILSSGNVICGGSGSASLALSSPITNVSGITYQWQSSSVATGPWANVGTNTTSYGTGTISSTMYYQCLVTCTATSSTYTTSVDTVNVSGNTPPNVSVTPNVGSACPGSTVSVTASATGGTGTVNYTWSPANGLSATTGATVNASAIAGPPTVYIVKGTDASGCTDTAQVRITANNAPAKTAIAILNGGNDSICSGVTLILRAGPGGGGAGGANTFSWSNGKTTRNDTIAPTTTTLYIVSVTAPATGCVTNDTINITVLPGTAPNVTVNPTTASFCTGSTPVTLTANGATTYSWTQPANGGLSGTTGASVTASPTVGGGPGGNVATYVVTGTTGSCSNTATVTVTIGSKPVLNPTIYPIAGNQPLPNDTVCAGTVLRLNSIPGGGANPWSYAWSDSKTTRIDTITAVATTTTYTVIATSLQGCGMDTGTITLVVNHKPTGSFSADTTQGLAVPFTNSVSGASGYNWTFGDGNSSINPNPTNTYANTGAYTVTLIAIGSTCGNDTIYKTIHVIASGINNIANAIRLNVYPNPANESTTVSFVLDAPKAQMTMLNTLGQTILSKSITAKMNNNFNEKISLAGLANGVYFVQIKTDNQLSTIKLVKE